MDPYVHSLGQCWDPRHHSIYSNTVFPLDPEPARQLQPNSCHRGFLLHPSACYLRLYSIYPGVRSPGRRWHHRHVSIFYYTVFAFDPEPARKLHPMFATLRLCCILQLAIFVSCPGTRTSILPVDAGTQGRTPSILTLMFRSTRNQRGNCNPICSVLLAVLLLAGIRYCTV
jgi:hypothetical protein